MAFEIYPMKKENRQKNIDLTLWEDFVVKSNIKKKVRKTIVKNRET